MNNAEALVTLSKYPNDPCGRAALRRNNADLFKQIVKEWFGSSPLVYETLLTQCALYARHFVPWRDDPDEFIRECVGRECRLLYARSKMVTNPPRSDIQSKQSSHEPKLELRQELRQELPEPSNSKLGEDCMSTETEQLRKIREKICQKHGHLYHRAEYVFARDEHGRPFDGAGWERAAKFVRLFCGRCTSSVEIEICPPLDIREPNERRLKSLATAA